MQWTFDSKRFRLSVICTAILSLGVVSTENDVAHCPNTATKCDASSSLVCLNGGTCCQSPPPTDHFCACPKGWTGTTCHIQEDDVYDIFAQSRDNTLRLIGYSSIIGIVVGVISLMALGVITFIIIRNWRKKHPLGLGLLEKEPNLDVTITYVEDEISKLSTVQQLNKLHRLSKLFEKTFREAILSDPGHPIDRPKSVVMTEHLPRWSSAPALVNRPPNEFDAVDGDDVFVVDKPRYETQYSHQGPITKKTQRFTAHL